jgi:hypothetical protein
MSRIIILLILALALALATLQCKDKGTTPPSDGGFSLAVTVENAQGEPIPGLQVSAWNIIQDAIRSPRIKSSGLAQSPNSTTSIEFVVKDSAWYRLDILNLDNQRISRSEGLAIGGSYTINWHSDSLGATVYRAILSLGDSIFQQIRFADTILMATDLSADPYQTIVGFTDNAGKLSTNKGYLFPYLYHLGTLTHTNESGPDAVGNFSYTDQVAVVITDTAAHRSITDTVTLIEGESTPLSIVFDPATAVPEYRSPNRAATSSEKLYLRGDLNCDGSPYQVADASTFLNFFLDGLSAFDSVECSIQGSDVNADGSYPNLADFVYLVRVVLGESQPFPKPSAIIPLPQANIGMYDSLGDTYFTNLSDDSVGAICLGIQGSVTPVLLASGVQMATSNQLDNTRIVIYPPFSGVIHFYGIGPGPFLKIVGKLDPQLFSIAASSMSGDQAALYIKPTKDRLYQNYPNPFN